MLSYHLRDRIASVVVLAVCMAGFVHTQDMPGGAALFPRLVLGLAGLLSLAWLASTFLGRSPAAAEPPKPFMENPLNLAIFAGSIVIYVFLIDLIGYFTSTVLFMVGASLALGFRRLPFTAAAVVLFIGFVYFIFRILFDRPLPLEFFQR